MCIYVGHSAGLFGRYKASLHCRPKNDTLAKQPTNVQIKPRHRHHRLHGFSQRIQELAALSLLALSRSSRQISIRQLSGIQAQAGLMQQISTPRQLTVYPVFVQVQPRGTSASASAVRSCFVRPAQQPQTILLHEDPQEQHSQPLLELKNGCSQASNVHEHTEDQQDVETQQVEEDRQDAEDQEEMPNPSDLHAAEIASSNPPTMAQQMLSMAQDPELLKLFFPYLPKNQHSLLSLEKALAIPGFQNQLLRGEAQAGMENSEITLQLRKAAPDRTQFDQQLAELGLYSLME